MKEFTMSKYGAREGPVGNGKLLLCIPNHAGVFLIQIYDILTLVLIFTLYRSYAACEVFGNETNIKKYKKARQITYAIEIVCAVAGFGTYTALIAVRGSNDPWDILLSKWLSTFLSLILFIVLENHFTSVVGWKE